MIDTRLIKKSEEMQLSIRATHIRHISIRATHDSFILYNMKVPFFEFVGGRKTSSLPAPRTSFPHVFLYVEFFTFFCFHLCLISRSISFYCSVLILTQLISFLIAFSFDSSIFMRSHISASKKTKWKCSAMEAEEERNRKCPKKKFSN